MTARETFGFGGVGREMNGLDLVWFWSLGGDGFRDMHLVAEIGRASCRERVSASV